jgi:hypothetical protein
MSKVPERGEIRDPMPLHDIPQDRRFDIPLQQLHAVKSVHSLDLGKATDLQI